jgi:hypothetical protein
MITFIIQKDKESAIIYTTQKAKAKIHAYCKFRRLFWEYLGGICPESSQGLQVIDMNKN